MPQEQLVRLLHELGKELVEIRQLARRLNELFPKRYRDLLHDYRDLSGSCRERVCLQDPRYLSSVDELIEMRTRVMHLKIQYETHLMLYQARQTLRSLESARRKNQHLNLKTQSSNAKPG
jgi:hypothetical protein